MSFILARKPTFCGGGFFFGRFFFTDAFFFDFFAMSSLNDIDTNKMHWTEHKRPDRYMILAWLTKAAAVHDTGLSGGL